MTGSADKRPLHAVQWPLAMALTERSRVTYWFSLGLGSSFGVAGYPHSKSWFSWANWKYGLFKTRPKSELGESVIPLGGHLKTGHRRTPENRPTERNRNNSSYILPGVVAATAGYFG
jgi:hypothetical protein